MPVPETPCISVWHRLYQGKQSHHRIANQIKHRHPRPKQVLPVPRLRLVYADHGLLDRHRHGRVLASLRLEGNAFTAPKRIPQHLTVLRFERKNVRGVVVRCVFAAARRSQLLLVVLVGQTENCAHSFLLVEVWSGGASREGVHDSVNMQIKH